MLDIGSSFFFLTHMPHDTEPQFTVLDEGQFHRTNTQEKEDI